MSQRQVKTQQELEQICMSADNIMERQKSLTCHVFTTLRLPTHRSGLEGNHGNMLQNCYEIGEGNLKVSSWNLNKLHCDFRVHS